MPNYEPSPKPWGSWMLSVLRVVTAILYIEHGTNKILGFPPSTPPPVPYVLTSLNGLAGVLETLGGFLILLGLFTRPVAFLLAGEMAVAYFKVHFPRSVFPIANRGDNVVMFCFVYLYLVFAGAGPWSVDALLGRSRRRNLTRGR